LTRTLQISAIVLSLILNINLSNAQSGAVVNYRDILLGAFPDTTRLSTWMAYVDENLEELVNGGIDQAARDSLAVHRSNINALYGLIGPGADSVRAAHTADTVTAILPVAQIAGIDSGDFAKVSLLDTYAVDSARAAFKADTVTGDLSKEQVGLGNVNNTADINKIVAYADTSRVTHRADTVLNMLPQSQITGLTAALAGKSGPVDSANFAKRSEVLAWFAAAAESTLIGTAIKLPMGYASQAIVIDTIVYIGTSNTTPSSTPKPYYGADITSGTAIITSPSAMTSSTTAVKVTSFDNGTIPAGNMVWLTFSAASTPHKTFAAIIYGHRQ